MMIRLKNDTLFLVVGFSLLNFYFFFSFLPPASVEEDDDEDQSAARDGDELLAGRNWHG